MPAILATIIAGIVNGGSVASVFGALTGGQWATLITGIGAELEPGLAKIFGVKTLSLDALATMVIDDLKTKAMRDWLTANAEQALKEQPGMGNDY